MKSARARRHWPARNDAFAAMDAPSRLHDIHPIADDKRRSAEVEAGPRVPALSDFLAAQLERMQAQPPQLKPGPGRGDELDEFFRAALRQDG